MMALFVFILGLIIGSFLAAYTYRKPRGIGISKGRSFTDCCKRDLKWQDNIPLFSYIFLQGKCRFCKKSISPRYFLIEISTALLFATAYCLLPNIAANLPYLATNYQSLITIFILTSLLVFIFVVDLEHQLIFDQAIWLGFLIIFLVFFATGFGHIFEYLLGGFIASFGLLFIYLATSGRGMGLGDVKFALLVGTILGVKLAIVWIFLSFIIGGIVGVFLLAGKFAKLKDRIAFGPFLVAAFFIVIFFYENYKFF